MSATASETHAQEDPGFRFLNREISDLQFIERVLEEARDARHPLLERLRFLAISAQVLDQYYSIRVALLERSVARADGYVMPDGMTPDAQLAKVLTHADRLAAEQASTWTHLRTALADAGLEIVAADTLDSAEQRWLADWFRSHAAPLLTPSMVDGEHPFPFIASDVLCALLEFRDRFVLVPMPRTLPRFVPLPDRRLRFVALEDALATHASELLPTEDLLHCGVFQVLRDNALAKQDHAADLMARIEHSLRRRHLARAVKLKVSEGVSAAGIEFLAEQLELGETDASSVPQALSDRGRLEQANVPALAEAAGLITDRVRQEWPNASFAPHTPRYPEALHDQDCFEVLRQRDVLAHWPYECFRSVVDFLDRAAADPDVLAIKQTLYRTSDDSPIVAALMRAAESGKAVTTIIELEARENESANVRLARALQGAGVHVIYGIVGLKIHWKATLVVRREGEATRSYTLLSSGNFHPGNARIYTDLSLFSADEALGRDVARVFNYVTAGTLTPTERLLVAPLQLREALYRLIDAEVEIARNHGQGRIIAKVNALTDPDLIERLYAASRAGVEIDLVVRRQCALRPGVEGLSDRIRVKSIVGRYLEHSRILLFGNGGAPGDARNRVLVGSADLMERNLDDRVEVYLPLAGARERRRVTDILEANLRDTRQSWLLGPDGRWLRADSGSEPFCAQSHFSSTR